MFFVSAKVDVELKYCSVFSNFPTLQKSHSSGPQPPLLPFNHSKQADSRQADTERPCTQRQWTIGEAIIKGEEALYSDIQPRGGTAATSVKPFKNETKEKMQSKKGIKR